MRALVLDARALFFHYRWSQTVVRQLVPVSRGLGELRCSMREVTWRWPSPVPAPSKRIPVRSPPARLHRHRCRSRKPPSDPRRIPGPRTSSTADERRRAREIRKRAFVFPSRGARNQRFIVRSYFLNGLASARPFSYLRFLQNGAKSAYPVRYSAYIFVSPYFSQTSPRPTQY